MTDKIANVNIRETHDIIPVTITSDLKPEIVNEILEKWQSLIDNTAKVIGIPSGLIMRLNEDNIEVFLKSKTQGNPYEVGEQAKLVYGLYCETVIGKQEKLIVPDAVKSPIWKSNNPDVDINMISYLGYPVNWPDGEVFGTVCVLDSKENHYTKQIEDLLYNVKLNLETDLELLLSRQNLEEKNQELSQANQLKAKFLSLISHDVRGGVGTVNEFLRMIVKNIDSYSNDDLKEMLEALADSANQHYSVLEDLLTWSRSDMLELEPEKTEVDLVELVKTVMSFLEQSFKLKELNTTVHIENENIPVLVDEIMFETAIRNILSNAIKYTSRGGSVSVNVEKVDNSARIIIEDNGIGIDQKTLDTLFNYQKDRKKGTEGESSAGIGLYLVRDFLAKNDAKVKVESKLGIGTRFEIVI